MLNSLVTSMGQRNSLIHCEDLKPGQFRFCRSDALPTELKGTWPARLFTGFIHVCEHLKELQCTASRFVHLEKFSLHFSSWSFAMRVNLLHP